MTAARPDGGLFRRHILVVDDDLGCLSSLEDLLTQDGYEISTARCGEEALDKLRWLDRQDRLPELSILDYEVPGWTGLETYCQLRRAAPRLGAIFISGSDAADLEGRVRDVGGFALVRKPLDSGRLRQTVTAYLDHARS